MGVGTQSTQLLLKLKNVRFAYIRPLWSIAFLTVNDGTCGPFIIKFSKISSALWLPSNNINISPIVADGTNKPSIALQISYADAGRSLPLAKSGKNLKIKPPLHLVFPLHLHTRKLDKQGRVIPSILSTSHNSLFTIAIIPNINDVPLTAISPRKGIVVSSRSRSSHLIL